MILLHQKILMDGGTFAFSSQYRSFIIQRKLLLKAFFLPETEENIHDMFRYPYSQAVDITVLQDESICPKCAEIIIELFDYGIKEGSMYAKRVGESLTVEEQTEYMRNNLMELVRKHLNA